MLMGGIALVMAVPWYVRNASIYGHLDILARRWHDTVVVGQLRTSEYLAQVGLSGVLERFFAWSFASFWGVFGWMGVWMDSRVYNLLLAFSLAAGIGLVALLVRGRWTRPAEVAGSSPGAGAVVPASFAAQPASPQIILPAEQRFQRWAYVLLALSALLTLSVYLSYNLIFVQTQARYLFPALPAMALAVAVGWQEALRPATARCPGLGLGSCRTADSQVAGGDPGRQWPAAAGLEPAGPKAVPGHRQPAGQLALRAAVCRPGGSQRLCPARLHPPAAQLVSPAVAPVAIPPQPWH
jgi:hypothetical protein